MKGSKPCTDGTGPKRTLQEVLETRKKLGQALAGYGYINNDVVVLDADVSNSTMIVLFQKEHPTTQVFQRLEHPLFLCYYYKYYSLFSVPPLSNYIFLKLSKLCPFPLQCMFVLF